MLSKQQHRLESFCQGNFGFGDILTGQVLSPGIDIASVAFAGQFPESLGGLETHRDIPILEFGSEKWFDCIGVVASQGARGGEFDVVARIRGGHSDERIGGGFCLGISKGRDEGHANLFVLVFGKWDQDFESLGILFDRIESQDGFASDFGARFAFEHLSEFGDPVVLFLGFHRGELGAKEAKLLDAFGEDHDFLAVLFPLVLDVGVEFFELEEWAIDAALREERKEEDARKGSLGCKPRLVGQHTHLGNRM